MIVYTNNSTTTNNHTTTTTTANNNHNDNANKQGHRDEGPERPRALRYYYHY